MQTFPCGTVLLTLVAFTAVARADGSGNSPNRDCQSRMGGNLGFLGRAATTISLCRSTSLDIGFGYNLSFQGGGVFTQTRQWIEPTLGFRFWL